ncbi:MULTISPECIES: permease prefix domain 1-containing protein [Sporosarcina]|uniref:permease prefix domain 1-containing protein n=1 Tax=Sporosarcina TaxID=1569 RepID=UPI000694950A|nr:MULTISPECIES: permease prefix domain 1-containing protein [Sporosarcina]WJY27606.1 permease prefix domain 1-containing protein [Sporosarcina sp. 0.2-SM1T-5]
MNASFERFVDSVVQETDCSRDEREDLCEELLVHLECAAADYKRNGYSEKEAEQMAMTSFGDGKYVGKTLQQAMYPYRRQMLLVLSIASLLMTYGLYLSQLFVMGDMHYGWLLLGVVTSSSMLFLILRPVASLNRRAVMNTLLVVHLTVMGAGLLLAMDLEKPYSTVFLIYDAIVLLLGLVLIFRTTIYDVPATDINLQTGTKILHYYNLFMGLLLICGTLFFLWVYLIFASDGYLDLWKLGVPLVVWGAVYALQLTLLKRHRPRTAWVMAALQLLMPFALFGLWIFTVRGGA